MNDAITQTIDMNIGEITMQSNRSLKAQVESLESLLRESAQYITQLSEQYMASLDEISSLTSRIEECKVKENLANETNRSLKSRLNELFNELDDLKIRNKNGSKKSSKQNTNNFSRSTSQDKNISIEDETFIRKMLQSNMTLMNAEGDLSSVYLEILQDLKEVAEKSCDKLVSADDDDSMLLSMFPNVIFEEKDGSNSSGTGSPAKTCSASPARKSKKSGSHRSRSNNEPDFLFGSPAKRFPILSNPAFEEDEEEEDDDDDEEDGHKSRVTLLHDDDDDDDDEKSDHEVGDEEEESDHEDGDNDDEDGNGEFDSQEEQQNFESDFEYYIRYGHDEVPMRREPETITYNENAMLKM